MARKMILPIGTKFHYLITISEPFLDSCHFQNKVPRRRSYVKCKCACGNIITRQCSLLIKQNVRSCGCFRTEILTKHQLCDSPEYHVWSGILKRCYNPKEVGYKNYGGRGISTCERWHTFSNFYQDMCPRPSAEHQIDRINNDGNYCKENCRWVTCQENQYNKRNTVKVTYEGNTYTLFQLATIANLPLAVVKHRYQSKWSIEHIVNTPERSRKRISKLPSVHDIL